MKILKRSLSLLLVLLMVLSFVACGGETDPDVNPGTGSGTTEGTEGVSSTETNTDRDTGTGLPPVERPDPNLEEFAGKNYIIIQHSEIGNPFGYSQDSLMGAHVAQRLVDVQNKYSCTLEFSQIAYNNDFASNVHGLLYAENGGDLVFSNNNAQLRKTLGTGGEESLMQDLLALDQILDFWNTDKWGSIRARECMMAGGTFYGVVPALWVDCTPLPYYQVVYNKDLLERFGATDPQEYWEKEEWDRDTMLDVILSCYDDTGAETVWGMTGTLSHMVCYTFLTTGMPFAIVDKINPDGTVEWHRGLNTPDAQEALHWLKTTLTANSKYFNNGKGDWTTWDSHTPFISESCAMVVTAPLRFSGASFLPWGISV